MKPQALVLALIVLGIMILTNSIVEQHGAPLLKGFFAAVSHASFLTFSLALACGFTRSKGLAVLLALIIVVSLTPANVQAFARALAPLGLGLLAGIAAASFVRESAGDKRAE